VNGYARAIQRDEASIERRRVESWPEPRDKARRERRFLVFTDESGFYLLPGVVKTYAPKARTPIPGEWQTRDHLSVMGGVTARGEIHSMVRPTSLNGLHAIESPVHMGRLGAERLLVIWNVSPIHRRAEVRAFLAEAGDAIHRESLPSYAPDPNPGEGLWRHLKDVEMRDLACGDLEQLHQELHLALGRVRQKSRLTGSFFEGAGLGL